MEFELGIYKEKVIRMLRQDSTLVELVMPTLDDDRFEILDNFLGGDLETTVRDSDTGAYKKEYVTLQGHIFDVPYIYSTLKDATNAICMDSYISKAKNESVKEVSVDIYVMCHKSNIKFNSSDTNKYRKLGFTGNRVDCIVQQIGKIVNGSKNFGIGKILPSPLNPIKPYYPNDNYYGKIITFKLFDFMSNLKKDN